MTMSLTTESSKGLPLRTTFNVKPGGQTHTHKEEVDGFSCAFEYSCQGGTHEEWKMEIILEPGSNEYTCKVFREGGTSYLFFSDFKLMIDGGHLKDAVALGEDNKALISEVEYDLDKRHNKVSSTDAFKSHLSFLMAGFTKEKEEL
ncbi:MYDGF-like protein [Mya arenaria]|uniref:MYDGF-like protein n=1 Tax=Mya arenaria TaxID=6604 RepID=A0ABY7E0C2_MYAAR|nr:MYDGF-like protein [Mya arenaria]